jgi:hypothetical protein
VTCGSCQSSVRYQIGAFIQNIEKITLTKTRRTVTVTTLESQDGRKLRFRLGPSRLITS